MERKRKHIHVMTDFELKMLDARRHLGVEDHVRKIQRALAAMAAACDETVPCGVCLEHVAPGRVATLPCGHAVCLDCVPHLLASFLKGVPRVSRIPCPGAFAAAATGSGAPCHVPVPTLLAQLPPGPVARELCVAYEYALHEEVIRDAVRAQVPDALGHPTLVEYRCCQPTCQWMHLLVRNEVRGIDVLIVCERCAMTQCTGCHQLVPTVVHTVLESPGDLHKAACKGPLHRPVAVVADVGDLSAIRRWSDLTLEQRNQAWCTLNRLIETGLAGTKCPSCDRLVSKDTNCTHLTCNAVGTSPGCGASFCFCCGGRFARTGKEYVQWLHDDDAHSRLALMHYTFSPALHAMPSVGAPRLDPPVDDTLVNGTEVHLPPFFHNDGWGHVFHPDVATPAGRCPTTLGSLLNKYPWFTPPPGQAPQFSSAAAEHWVTQRWSELKVLRGLYAWSQEHRVRPAVLKQLLAHPRCLACNMEFVQQWLAHGAIPPTALLAYEQVVGAPTVRATPRAIFPAPPASALRKRREASLWAQNNLAWQRWVLCGAPPTQSRHETLSPPPSPPVARRTIVIVD